MPSKPVRRTRREPAYFYRSAAATVDGVAHFGDSCVVLPHARVSVPAGYVLEVGPFTLVEDYAEVLITAADPVPATGTPVTLSLGSHNHFRSYARLHIHLTAAYVQALLQVPLRSAPAQLHTSRLTAAAAAASPPPATVELLGSGNVFHSFASVQVGVASARRECGECPEHDPRSVSSSTPAAGPLVPPPSRQRRHPPWQLGCFNVFAAHSTTACLTEAEDSSSQCTPPAAAGQTPQQCQRGGQGSALFPLPSMPAIQPCTGGEGDSAKDAPREGSEEPSMPGRTSVEERLFQDSSDDDEGDNSTRAPARGKGTDTCTPESPTTRTSAAGVCVSDRVFLPGPSGAGVPRYGTRSVSELPVIIKRITEEERQKREAAQQQQQQQQGNGKGGLEGAGVADSASPLAEAAAAAALTGLEPYASAVHAELRAFTEEKVRVDVECMCRFYVRQYIDGVELYSVEAQYDTFS